MLTQPFSRGLGERIFDNDCTAMLTQPFSRGLRERIFDNDYTVMLTQPFSRGLRSVSSDRVRTSSYRRRSPP